MHRAEICRIEGTVKLPTIQLPQRPRRIFESPNTIRTVVRLLPSMWFCTEQIATGFDEENLAYDFSFDSLAGDWRINGGTTEIGERAKPSKARPRKKRKCFSAKICGFVSPADRRSCDEIAQFGGFSCRWIRNYRGSLTFHHMREFSWSHTNYRSICIYFYTYFVSRCSPFGQFSLRAARAKSESILLI